MLKSTYQKPAPGVDSAPPPLPSGWVEHRAPTGHPYYYHAETQTSTYTRPEPPSEAPLSIDYGATEPDHVVRASMQVMDEFNRNHNPVEPGHFTGGRSYQEHSRRRGNQGDRPKSKTSIPSCQPWVLVKTKKGRRFVHNTETKESLWKFPQDVMMAVIELDTLEWKAKKASEDKTVEPQKSQAPEESVQSADQMAPLPDQEQTKGGDYDSDSYEEVEVTDDEGDEGDPTTNKNPAYHKTTILILHHRPRGPSNLMKTTLPGNWHRWKELTRTNTMMTETDIQIQMTTKAKASPSLQQTTWLYSDPSSTTPASHHTVSSRKSLKTCPS